MRKMEEKNKGKSNPPWRRHRRTRGGRRKATCMYMADEKGTIDYSESRTPAIDDQTLNRSLTLIGGVLTIFVEGHGRESKHCNSYDEHNGRRE